MPKNGQATMSSASCDSSKSNIDSYWVELKKEYDEASKNKEQEYKFELEKEKKEFAKMWEEAGLDLKENLEKNCIITCKKKN